MKNNKKVKVYALIVGGALLTLLISFSLAFFTSKILNNKAADVKVNLADNAKLEFINDEQLSIHATMANFSQGKGNLTDTVTASAKLTAESSFSEKYSVAFEIIENGFIYTQDDKTPELILEINNPDGDKITNIKGLKYVTVNGISGFDVTDIIGYFEIENDYLITVKDNESSEIHDWQFKINFVNLDGEQTENTNKIFDSNIVLRTTERETFVDQIIALEGNGQVAHEITDSEYLLQQQETIIFVDKSDYLNVAYEGQFAFVEGEGGESGGWMNPLIQQGETSSFTFSFNSSEESELFLTFMPLLAQGEEGDVASDDFILKFYINDEVVGDKNSDYINYMGTPAIVLSGIKSTDKIKIEFINHSEKNYMLGLALLPAPEKIKSMDAGYRYQGDDPDNYVMFNDELWRIIGVLDADVNDAGNVKKEKLVKIIKETSLGEFQWDNSNSGDGIAAGINWATSDLYYLLNNSYYNSTNGNNDKDGSGHCWGGGTNTNCNYTLSGIKDKYRILIENVIWNYGLDRFQGNSYPHSPSGRYLSEKIGFPGEVSLRNTSGYVGLASLSDIGFSFIEDFSDHGWYSEISWIGNNYSHSWALNTDGTRNYVFGNSGTHMDYIYTTQNVLPAVYLKSDIKIYAGDGTKEKPYIIDTINY